MKNNSKGYYKPRGLFYCRKKLSVVEYETDLGILVSSDLVRGTNKSTPLHKKQTEYSD